MPSAATSSTTSSWRPVAEDAAPSPKRSMSKSNISFTMPAFKKTRVQNNPEPLERGEKVWSSPFSDVPSATLNPNHSPEDANPSSASAACLTPDTTGAMAPSRHEYVPCTLPSIPEIPPSTISEGQATTAPNTHHEEMSKTTDPSLNLMTLSISRSASPQLSPMESSSRESSSKTGITSPMIVDTRSSFASLPSEVAHKILKYVFVREGSHIIRPFYRKGMLAGSIRTGNDLQRGTSDEVVWDNVDDLRLMRLSKQFQSAGSRYFYGEHTFYFDDPALCKWWFKTIGSQNVSNIRSLSLSMGSGFTVNPEVRCAFDLTQEEQWYQFLCWFKSRHNLHELRIEFYQWSQVQYIRVALDAKEEIHTARTKLLGKLSSLRGIGLVEVFDHDGHYMNSHGCRVLELQIMQEKDTAVVRPDQRNKPLSQVMEELRVSRLRNMAAQQSQAAAEAEPQKELKESKLRELRELAAKRKQAAAEIKNKVHARSRLGESNMSQTQNPGLPTTTYTPPQSMTQVGTRADTQAGFYSATRAYLSRRSEAGAPEQSSGAAARQGTSQRTYSRTLKNKRRSRFPSPWDAES